jgi:hypothetical protein
VSHRDPLKKVRRLLTVFKLDDEMPVIWHQAVLQNRQGLEHHPFSKNANERFVIFRLVENRLASNPPIHDVTNVSCLQMAMKAWHDDELLGRKVIPYPTKNPKLRKRNIKTDNFCRILCPTIQKRNDQTSLKAQLTSRIHAKKLAIRTPQANNKSTSLNPLGYRKIGF